jgi:hypothetical protein
MAFRQLGDLFVVVHTAAPPRDEEWGAYFEAVSPLDPLKTRTLVFTRGGGPNADQRARVKALLNGRTSLVSVVTESVWVRTLVKVLQWDNPQMRAFSPDEMDEAYRHLRLTPAEIDAASREMAAMRRELRV